MRGSRTDAGSYRRRLILSTAVFGAVVAVLLVLVVQVALSRSSTNAVASLLDDRADAVISSVDAASTTSVLEVPDARLDPGVAVYDAHGVRVGGTVPPSQAKYFAELSTTDAKRRLRLGDAYELLGQPFRTSGGGRGVVVISEPLKSYHDILHVALTVSILAGAVIVLLATALAAWASRRALAPVAEMARVADEWSAHNLDGRFDLGPPTNEIRALGQTLDGLLDRVSRAILEEQRLTSELAHELRTPLSAVLATAEVIGMRTDLDAELRQDLTDISTSCREMAATVTSLVELARSQAGGGDGREARLLEVVQRLVRDLGGEDRFTVDLDPDLVVSVPPELAARALNPVLENAARLAEHIRVSTLADGRWVRVLIADDGPGVDSLDAESIFVPGHSGQGGSGLGLALARRVARSAGGDVSLRPQPELETGAVFEVRLPRGRPQPATGSDAG